MYIIHVWPKKHQKTNHVIPTLHLLWRQRKGPLCQVRRQRLPEGPRCHRGDPAEGLGLTLVENMDGFYHGFTIVLLEFTMVFPCFYHVFTMFKHVRPNPDVAPHLQSS